MVKNAALSRELRRLDENTLKVIAALCKNPEEGRHPSELWSELQSEMGKGTLYKRLENLLGELKCIEIIQHPTDRRMAIYKIRPEHLLLCRERSAGFEVSRLMKQTRLRSLDPAQPGKPKAISIGKKQAWMNVFTNKNLNVKPLVNLLDSESFQSDLERVVGGLFQKLFEGMGEAAGSKALIIFHHEAEK